MSERINALAVIPARYASTRFPGKPLALIQGKTMLQRVYEQVKKSHVKQIIIATDHDAIETHAKTFNATVMMTRTDHISGTDRIAEVIQRLDQKFDVVVNIQGDEPFIHPGQINKLIDAFSDPTIDIATMVKPVSSADEYHSADVVKAVLAVNGNALYFSRQSIPYFRKGFDGKKLQQNVYKHLGMYAYRAEVIKKIALLPVAPLEEAEQLEQLRWLQNGYTIRALLTNIETIAVDTPDDLKKAENFLNKK
jgi:3-deoxy-manno-octulosonate cytidylyltransferase (CMP-KDO synthetase)